MTTGMVNPMDMWRFRSSVCSDQHVIPPGLRVHHLQQVLIASCRTPRVLGLHTHILQTPRTLPPWRVWVQGSPTFLGPGQAGSQLSATGQGTQSGWQQVHLGACRAVLAVAGMLVVLLQCLCWETSARAVTTKAFPSHTRHHGTGTRRNVLLAQGNNWTAACLLLTQVHTHAKQ